MPGFFCHHPNIQSLSHCRWQTILNNVHRITENICYNVFPENEQSESFRKMKTSDFFGVKFRCFASKVRMFLSKKSDVFDFQKRFRMKTAGNGSVGCGARGGARHHPSHADKLLHKKVSEKKHTFPTPFQENTFVCYAFRV